MASDPENPPEGGEQPDDLTILEGESLSVLTSQWTPEDVSLYALSIGAEEDGQGTELDLTWGSGGPSVVFPTFGVLAAQKHSLRFSDLPVSTNRFVTLNAGHSMKILGTVPLEGRVITTGTIASVTAVRAGVLVVRESVSRLNGPDSPVLWINRAATYLRGARAQNPAVPTTTDQATPPDLVLPFRTTPNQALLYGMNGDNNPLHGDPSHAREAGFDVPILHGLCTFGIVARRILAELGNHDWGAVSEVGARFRKPVLPGESGTILVWEREGGWSFEAWTSRGCVLRGGHLQIGGCSEGRGRIGTATRDF